MGELAESRPKGSIPLIWADHLSSTETEATLREALAYADLAELNLATAQPQQRAQDAEAIALVRAFASLRLAGLGDDARWSEAERLARPLIKSAKFGGWALTCLFEALLDQDRVEEATQLLQDPAIQQRFSEDPDVQLQFLWIQLARGEQELATAISHNMFKLADKTSDDNRTAYLFVAALGQLLTQSGDWDWTARKFIGTGHPYRNYIAMMLYNRLAGAAREEAREVLERAWAQADPTGWSERLRGGDQAPWREMLIGYYLGKEQAGREAIFGPLKDDVVFASSDFRFMGLPRQGMLCEAHFYDALLRESRGDQAGMREALDAVIGTDHRSYFEYEMARFLLREQ